MSKANSTEDFFEEDVQEEKDPCRKEIIVSFIDLCGSTALKAFEYADNYDESDPKSTPPEWFQVISSFFQVVTECVDRTNKIRYTGNDQKIQILKFIGDEVMIAKETGEDKKNSKYDADSVMMAINLICDEWSTISKNYGNIRLKIGIHTGPTFRTSLKGIRDHRGERVIVFDYFGKTIDACARITGMADGGCLLISDEFFKVLIDSEDGNEGEKWSGRSWIEIELILLKGLGAGKIWCYSRYLPDLMDGSRIQKDSILFKALKHKY